MLILPYHETNIFVRVLQLLDLKKPGDSWHWLHSLQKPGIHLPKNTLYNRAASDPHFIQFITKFILTVITEHENPSCLTVIFNFYCAVFVGSIEYSKEITEAQISQMLPVLLKGLKSDIPDFCAGTYIVLARLVLKTDLTSKLLTKLIDRITMFPVQTLWPEAVTLLLIIFQRQQELKGLRPRSIENICKAKWLPKYLQRFDTDGLHVSPLLEGVIRECVKYGILKEEAEEVRQFVIDLLNRMKFEDGFVGVLIKYV